MTETYTYTDSDGLPLRITPYPGAHGIPGARLATGDPPSVEVDAADVVEVCRAILAAAGVNAHITLDDPTAE